MAHRFAVGVKDQAPLLFVVTATASPATARVCQTELVGRYVTEPPGASSALRPVWSRAVAAGTLPTVVAAQPLDPFAAPSVFQGEHTYAGVAPDIGFSSTPYPMDERKGYSQRALYPPGSGLVIPDTCPLAVQADATGDWVWDCNIVFEEL